MYSSTLIFAVKFSVTYPFSLLYFNETCYDIERHAIISEEPFNAVAPTHLLGQQNRLSGKRTIKAISSDVPVYRLESIATVKYLFEHAHINQMIRVNRSSWCNNVKVKKMPMTRHSVMSNASSTWAEGFIGRSALLRTYSRKKM